MRERCYLPMRFLRRDAGPGLRGEPRGRPPASTAGRAMTVKMLHDKGLKAEHAYTAAFVSIGFSIASWCGSMKVEPAGASSCRRCHAGIGDHSRRRQVERAQPLVNVRFGGHGERRCPDVFDTGRDAFVRRLADLNLSVPTVPPGSFNKDPDIIAVLFNAFDLHLHSPSVAGQSKLSGRERLRDVEASGDLCHDFHTAWRGSWLRAAGRLHPNAEQRLRPPRRYAPGCPGTDATTTDWGGAGGCGPATMACTRAERISPRCSWVRSPSATSRSAAR